MCYYVFMGTPRVILGYTQHVNRISSNQHALSPIGAGWKRFHSSTQDKSLDKVGSIWHLICGVGSLSLGEYSHWIFIVCKTDEDWLVCKTLMQITHQTSEEPLPDPKPKSNDEMPDTATQPCWDSFVWSCTYGIKIWIMCGEIQVV